MSDAAARRDGGMAAAVEHADRAVDSWSVEALASIIAQVEHGLLDQPTLAEAIRERSYALDLPRPPDGRAWGAVIQSAVRRGIIVHDGYANAASSNLSPKKLWRRADAFASIDDLVERGARAAEAIPKDQRTWRAIARAVIEATRMTP